MPVISRAAHGTESAPSSPPMATAAAHASLMDDQDFVAELEKFDAPGARVNATAASAQDASASQADDDLDDVWESRATLYQPPPPPALTRTRQPERELEPEFEDDEPPAVEEPHVARDVAGFLLMMALGAAGAVLVFHDRVALLLR